MHTDLKKYVFPAVIVFSFRTFINAFQTDNIVSHTSIGHSLLYGRPPNWWILDENWSFL
jgi:hypothetical protein